VNSILEKANYRIDPAEHKISDKETKLRKITQNKAGIIRDKSYYRGNRYGKQTADVMQSHNSYFFCFFVSLLFFF
jgi:hypothetical protein